MKPQTASNANPPNLEADLKLTIAFVLLAFSTAFASVSVKISTPANGATTSSPVAVSASASSTAGSITGWKIYVDGAAAYSAGATSSIAASLPIGTGSHSLTVKAWDATGANGSAALTISVTSSTTTPTTTTTPPSSALVFSSMQTKTGWKICSGSCSGGGSGTYYMRQNISSPSLSGHSTEFHISPSTSFYDLMWYIGTLTNNSTATNFKVDIDQYIANPAAPQAIEYGLNQQINSSWYKFSTQCAFSTGVWRVWDSYNRGWVNTSVPCKRPAANTWVHYTMQYKRASGKAVFVSFSINGQTYYVNKSFSPQGKSGTNGAISIHYQLDGNSAKTSYSTWVDRWTLTMW